MKKASRQALMAERSEARVEQSKLNYEKFIMRMESRKKKYQAKIRKKER